MGLENPLHLLILGLVVLLVFGAKRLPEIGRSLGDGMRGFKETIQGDTHHATPTDQVIAEPTIPPVAVPASAVRVAVAANAEQPGN